MFDLSDVIDRIEYSIGGKEDVYYLEDRQDIDGTKLIINLLHTLKLVDCNLELEDHVISIEEIIATLRYNVTVNFSKLDVATDECEYIYDVNFDYAFIESMSSNEELEDLITSKIEKIVISGERFKLEDLTLKPVLKKLQ